MVNSKKDDMNLSCKHRKKDLFGDFCVVCGAIYQDKISNNKFPEIFTVKSKMFCTSLTIPPLEVFNYIEKLIAYKTYFKQLKKYLTDFYKKARITCIKYIKKQVEDNKFSNRAYILAIFYLDCIYLNYDYFTILKDFKSELIALGCFLIAGKFFNNSKLKQLKVI